jgi:C4-dicarboxylate transporter, DctQ subunit
VRAVDRVIEGFEDLVVALGLCIATIAAFAEVVARFVFNTSTGAGGELTNYSIIWAAMIGAAVAARSGVHIGVDVVVKQMPPVFAKWTVLTALAISALFTLWVTVLGVELTQFSFGTGQTTMELLWPRWPLFLSVPVGMALMTYHLVRELVHRLRQAPEMFLHEVTETSLDELADQHAGA